jgi:hypothetical protein
MKQLKPIIIVILIIVLLLGGTFFLIGYLKPKKAGILIKSEPTADVFINGQQVGRTPYEETREAGELIVKLIPESLEKPLAPFETKVTLVSGVKTVIEREFGESVDTSSGQIVSFEKVGGNETSLSIVSVPDVAQISIDGQTRGFAPYKTAAISPGEHELIVSMPGYKEKTIEVKTYTGYKLIAFVKLAPSEEATEAGKVVEEEVPLEEEEVEVEILSTPTGFLRVRSEPSTLGEEIGRVAPGERYPLLEEDEETGWFKIEFKRAEEGLPAQAGWVSNQYAEKIEESEEILPTPTSSPTASPAANPTASPSL